MFILNCTWHMVEWKMRRAWVFFYCLQCKIFVFFQLHRLAFKEKVVTMFKKSWYYYYYLFITSFWDFVLFSYLTYCNMMCRWGKVHHLKREHCDCHANYNNLNKILDKTSQTLIGWFFQKKAGNGLILKTFFKQENTKVG